jgi:hypothetical protein
MVHWAIFLCLSIGDLDYREGRVIELVTRRSKFEKKSNLTRDMKERQTEDLYHNIPSY